jgi:hypothetical protein
VAFSDVDEHFTDPIRDINIIKRVVSAVQGSVPGALTEPSELEHWRFKYKFKQCFGRPTRTRVPVGLSYHGLQAERVKERLSSSTLIGDIYSIF